MIIGIITDAIPPRGALKRGLFMDCSSRKGELLPASAVMGSDGFLT